MFFEVLQKLASLPPTNEAFKKNVAPAKIQIAIWKRAAFRKTYMHVTQLHMVCKSHVISKSLAPMSVSGETVFLVPQVLLKLIRFSCRGDTPCFWSYQGGHSGSNDDDEDQWNIGSVVCDKHPHIVVWDVFSIYNMFHLNQYICSLGEAYVPETID